jgi:hypothetical protein
MQPTETISYPADGLARRTRIDPHERRARNRAHASYIRNALDPTSAGAYDDVTIGDLKARARQWVDDTWTEYLDA